MFLKDNDLNQKQVTSGKSTQRDLRAWFCQCFGDHISKNLDLYLRCLQRSLGLSLSLDLNAHKTGWAYKWFECALNYLCRHTWRSLENKGFFSEKGREGYNQQGWWLRGSTDDWRCKWLLQVGAAGWMVDAPGLETEKEALSNNSLASLSKQNPALGAYCGPSEFQPSCLLSISLSTILDVPFRTSVGYTIFR